MMNIMISLNILTTHGCRNRTTLHLELTRILNSSKRPIVGIFRLINISIHKHKVASK